MLMPQKSKCYWWTDTPDGEDIMKKTSLAMKIGYLFGMPVGLYDLAMQPQRNMYLHLFRYTRIVVPFMGVGAMFSLTTQFLCKEFPDLDRKLAYAIGGASVGTVVHASAKNRYIGSIVAFWGFFSCYLIRDIQDHGESGWGQPVRQNRDNDWELFRFSPSLKGDLDLPPITARPARGGSHLGL